MKLVGNTLLETNEQVQSPRLHPHDLAVLEDELKPEYDVLNNIVKSAKASKEISKKLTEDNQSLTKLIEQLRIALNGELRLCSELISL